MHLIPEITVLDIQRMYTEDGPGLRTTVFLKGCNLHCAWCHNPESIDARPIVQWNRVKCIGCDSCRSICENRALVRGDSGISIDGGQCVLCLACVRECPSGALRVRGERFEGPELLKELLKDRAYFGEEGGITLSGGEPLMQAEAVLWLLRELKKEGLQTALDTAGLVPMKKLFEALAYTDLLLYDIKLIDSMLHKKHTGSGNEQILENLKQVVLILNKNGQKLWIRTPIIPGATASMENIAAIGAFIAESLADTVERWELCAFNNLCKSKYDLAGLDWLYKDATLIPKAEMERLTQKAAEKVKGTGVAVLWTGATASEAEEE
ncbi:MAG: glycyl-radical enzyme activating protein [Clostridia bacterium]|nr:glycyl-radical enzyme activating protein [Clostridia bacterium]